MGPAPLVHTNDSSPPSGEKKGRAKRKPESAKEVSKQSSSKRTEGGQVPPTKRPRRAAAAKNLKEKSVRLSDDSQVLEAKRLPTADEEFAVRMTHAQEEAQEEATEDERPNRRLTDFIVHDVNGVARPLEMIEVDDMFISGVILPLEDDLGKEEEVRVKCEGFGRIEEWSISGYEKGSPVVWLSTSVAHYECQKPANGYRKFYDHFFQKAQVCIEVHKTLTKSSQGSFDMSLDELLAGVVRAMSGTKYFSGAASVKEFVISQGDFVYNQLKGLDETSKNAQKFKDLSVLLALNEEKHGRSAFRQGASLGGSLTIGGGAGDRVPSTNLDEEQDDAKYARVLQDQELWDANKRQDKKYGRPSASSTTLFRIKEDKIAEDYPLPAYYKHSEEETDEYIAVEIDDILYPDDLPKKMLYNWSLYNSDSRLVSLELLPMRLCEGLDVTIFGSGIMSEDLGTGFCFDGNSGQSSSASLEAHEEMGLPVFLGEIKEWLIDFGAEDVSISFRTDLAWYRLGNPSKQYAPWFKPVLKTARLATSIIKMLKQQSRVSRSSFADINKYVCNLEKEDHAFISSNPDTVERYMVVHGQIILQVFAEFPDPMIKRCAFIVSLANKMKEMHNTTWTVKKKAVLQKTELNLNPRAAMDTTASVKSKRKVMQATTTRLINRIWGEYYSNYSPEDLKEGVAAETVEDEVGEQEENEDDAEEESQPVSAKIPKPSSVIRKTLSRSSGADVRWDGAVVGKTCSGGAIYKEAIVHGEVVVVGAAVMLEVDKPDEIPAIYFIEYMFETPSGSKMFHGRLMQRGSETVLGNTANERELFLTNMCMTHALQDIEQVITFELRKTPWGFQRRKENANADRIDRARAEERKKKGLPLEYYCKSLYWPEKGAFVTLPYDLVGLGSGDCYACKLKEAEEEKEKFEVNSSMSGFLYRGTRYSVLDFVYITPDQFAVEKESGEIYKGGRNVGLKPFVVCQLLEIIASKRSKEAELNSTQVKIRRFFRPDDISAEKAYTSDVRELYYSEETHVLSIETIEGKCEVRKKNDMPTCTAAVFDHIFFCEHLYDPSNGSLKQLPTHVKLRYSTVSGDSNGTSRKRKGKGKEGEDGAEIDKQLKPSQGNCLATLDIFAGCGGLSEGAASTRWAIEAVMEKCGDADDCISTPEAGELAASLEEKVIHDLPVPGQVDFINGGPPCQGFSGMNRFNQSTWSKVQCEMILAFLSFADYFRPKYFLLENVRNFVSFNKGQTFRLTLASLLEMGYQVRFGILEAGAYGVSQSRKRAFIWAAAPEETLPEWPEPMHVFAAPELKINLSDSSYYAAARSTTNGAPFRAITVRDTIGDLPAVGNGASETNMEYNEDPVSWFQKKIRGDAVALTDHISKEMNELNLIRCKKIPRRPGADWRDLPEEKVRLSTGQLVDLIPWCLPNTASRHNQWKGLFGRLDWDGNFPTSITDPQPMGKVGMCFHPEQDRIVTVRECARFQGFPDSYKFAGNIQHKHRQIGNAVPPPLAYALGVKLKEALDISFLQVSGAQELKGCGFQAIYAFGDSLTDTGNNKGFAERPPYGNTTGKQTGRASDGLLVIDYIAQSAGLPLLNPSQDQSATFQSGADFARSGVTVMAKEFKPQDIYEGFMGAFSLDFEIKDFESRVKTICKDPTAPDCKKKMGSSLFFLWMGINDYNFALADGDEKALPHLKTIEQAKQLKLVPSVVADIIKALKTLISYGATQVLVLGLPPHGCSPYFLTTLSKNTSAVYDEHQCLKDYNDFLMYHNIYLQEALGSLQKEYPNTNIVYGDTYKAMRTILAEHTKYGIEMVSQACCGVGGKYHFTADVKQLCGQDGVPSCSDPSKHIFFDQLHFTQNMNEKMAGLLIQDILPKLKC
ncbi:hypothetical protein Tsubulata_038149 [Turnera subulata]|uniref:Cytosine-specific methyltransferase n=1 Tax=Turnera subulata TaxID=218843 RepID=A0A9Q0JED1_9ROSI|nr:hypothetical protein Tsubulata_038149 [Turnera subulata]